MNRIVFHYRDLARLDNGMYRMKWDIRGPYIYMDKPQGRSYFVRDMERQKAFGFLLAHLTLMWPEWSLDMVEEKANIMLDTADEEWEERQNEQC